MAQEATKRERIQSVELDEGDRVFMGIQLHGLCDDVPGTEYDKSIYQAGVEGTVTKALSDFKKEMMQEGRKPLADVKVETDDGQVFTWNVDNGYVIGYNEKHDRRTDVGRFAGFYEA